MRVGVLGSGGREHALAWVLARSPQEPEVFVLPGNGGTQTNVAVDPRDPDLVVQTCHRHKLDLLVVGGEEPLAAGVVDRLRGTSTVPFGPTASAARLESSKVWAKGFLRRHRIPTAPALEAASEDDVRRGVQLWGHVVVKADGLAAGKGVVVCRTEAEALAAWRKLRSARPDGEPILVEQALAGWELSILCITDGRVVALLPPARDHKAVFDMDCGPNTGGMGAYAPAPQCTPELESEVVRRIVGPTLSGLRDEEIDYCGFLYFGLMVTRDGPQVLEYNARLGDPEAEVLLPLLAGDFLAVVQACLCCELAPGRLDVLPGAAVDVVLAARGYPGDVETGAAIEGIDSLDPEVLLFHGATERDGAGWRTAGGRVLHVVGIGDTVAAAADAAYRNAEQIRFAGRHMRHDIGRGVE